MTVMYADPMGKWEIFESSAVFHGTGQATQQGPPVKEPPNEPAGPPVKEPPPKKPDRKPPKQPPPPGRPPVEEPPNRRKKPPVEEPPPKDPDREPPKQPPMKVFKSEFHDIQAQRQKAVHKHCRATVFNIGGFK
jgi:hypothetical protein